MENISTRTTFSVEIENNPVSLMRCLKKLEREIVDFEYEWTLRIRTGGIDWGVYLNAYVDSMVIEISNEPGYGMDGDDMLEDIIKCVNDDEEEEDEDED